MISDEPVRPPFLGGEEALRSALRQLDSHTAYELEVLRTCAVPESGIGRPVPNGRP